MDLDTFFNRIRQNLIDLMSRALIDLGSARVQTSAWIRFIQALEDDFGNVIEADRMLAHMNTQIKNPALVNSRFRFEEVLFLDVSFYWLNLTQGSSYIPLPSWIVNKKAVINPKNENDEECFKWAVTAALHHGEIKSNPEHVSNLKRFANNYDWFGLEFPVAINKISEFEKKNNASVNILGVKGKQIYICRKSKYKDQKNVNLLLINDGGKDITWQLRV